MTIRIPNHLLLVTLGLLFSGSAVGKAGIGDWTFQLERSESGVEQRIAFTRAHPHAGVQPRPKLVIRRVKPDSPVELMITATHDTRSDKCAYTEWKIVIDATEVPVLGYTFEPAKTELKAKLGTPRDQLWSLFRKGFKLMVEVEQKCDSASGVPNPVSHSFSLRGSNAAYKFVKGTSR